MPQMAPMPPELIMALLSVAVHPDEVADWGRTGPGEYTIRRKATVTPVHITITLDDDDPAA